MTTCYLGVDPGKTGGLALLDTEHRQLLMFKMPPSEFGVWDMVCDLSKKYTLYSVVEKVQGFIGSRQPGSAMFTFGMGYGGLRMALVGNGVPFAESAPAVWQRRMGVPPRKKGETKPQYKRRLHEVACRLFPRHRNRISLAVADAVLLAEFARRQHQGEFNQKVITLKRTE